MIVGTEWLIEAAGCSKEALRDASALRAIFSSVIADLELKTIGEVFWHKFEGEGGITGLAALTESHLTCHTYPEHGLATFNLYCCRERREWDWEIQLTHALAAEMVSVRKIERGDLKSEISNFKSEISDQGKPEFSNPKSQISNLRSETAGGDA